tara:strand:- start:193 stop:414 length:222 start_codon:yes stop_codon:yes gene_type:complete
MKLSNQAMGAVMMALQKCIIEQSDIVEILKGFDFELGTTGDESEDQLIVANPPVVPVPDDVLVKEVDESHTVS